MYTNCVLICHATVCQACLVCSKWWFGCICPSGTGALIETLCIRWGETVENWNPSYWWKLAFEQKFDSCKWWKEALMASALVFHYKFKRKKLKKKNQKNAKFKSKNCSKFSYLYWTKNRKIACLIFQQTVCIIFFCSIGCIYYQQISLATCMNLQVQVVYNILIHRSRWMVCSCSAHVHSNALFVVFIVKTLTVHLHGSVH